MKKSASFLMTLVCLFGASADLWAQKSLRRKGPLAAPAAPQRIKITTEFEDAGAFRSSEGTLIKWTMKAESGNLGFYVYRLGEKGETLVSDNLLTGSATLYGDSPVYGEEYGILDAESEEGTLYRVEFVLMDGSRRRSDPILPVDVASLQQADPEGKYLHRKNASVVANDLFGMPKDLASENDQYRNLADPQGHQFAITQPGVRIGVRGAGLYQVSRAELEAAGFSTAVDPAMWRLFRDGVEQAITVGPSGSYVRFYGSGVDTVESDIRTYYLITGTVAGKRIESRPLRANTAPARLSNYQNRFTKRERINYSNQVLNGDAENFWGRAVTSTATTLPFQLTGIEQGAETARVTIVFQGFSFEPHQVELILNGNTMTAATGNGRSPYSVQMTVPIAWLTEGANSLQMRAVGPTNDISFFNYIRIDFSRRFVAEDNQLSFFTQNYKSTLLEGFSSPNVAVYDVTDPSAPVLVTNLEVRQTGSTFGPYIPSSRGRVYFASDDAAIKPVHSVTANDPGLLSVPTHAANLVILTHNDWMVQAEAWANYRRAQGLAVKVVDVAEVYDEFNYGVLESLSIERFLNYAKNNWATRPNYVLLIGDASFDSRNYTGAGYWNMVPTRLVSTVFIETGSDESLADFDDDGLAEMAVGRIPVRTAQSITDVMTRVAAWEASLNNPLARGALFAFDRPDGWDFEAMSGRLRDQLPAGTSSTMVSRLAPTAQADVINAINTGKFLVNYSGHGTTSAWATTGFFSSSNVPQLTNATAPSIFTMLTCLNGYFLNTSGDSLSETLLKANNGGAVAVWASTGLTTPDVQEVMGGRFYQKIGEGSIPRIGDLIRDAKFAVPGGTDVRLSWTLIGDPMLKVR